MWSECIIRINNKRVSQFSAFLLQHLESCGTMFTLMKSCFEKFQWFSFSSMLIQVKGVEEFAESVSNTVEGH